MPDVNVAIIGYGTMGKAIARALKGAASLSLISPHITPTDHARIFTTLDDYYAHDGVLADIMILAVKPHMIGRICTQLSDYIGPEQIVLSIAAGISTPSIASHFKNKPQIARLMPNLAIGQGGACGLFIDPQVKVKYQDKIIQFCNQLGRVFVLDDEEMMHGLTAISGSGPAYFYQLCLSLAQAAQAQGLPPELADDLARQTLIDAATILAQAEAPNPDALIQAIAVPGGTTQAGLDALCQHGVGRAAQECISAATQKSKDLSG